MYIHTFFYKFLDVFVAQNRVLRLNEGLFRGISSTKEFTFEPSIEYPSFKLTAELQLTKKEILFILENLKVIETSQDNILKTLFIIYDTQICKKSPAKFFIPSFL